MTDSEDPATAGSELTYTIRLFNTGPDTAHDIRMVDDLSQQTQFISLSVSQEDGLTCELEKNNVQVVCTLAELAPGQAVTIVITVEIDSKANGEIRSNVRLSLHEKDPDPSNNIAQESTEIEAPKADPSPTSESLLFIP